MKKLMMTLAAAFTATAILAVESQNIVGYQTISASGTYPMYGATFITVGDTNGTWTLSDITADGMDPFTDIVQFLDPNNLSVTLTATYIDAATAAAFGDPNYQGWWDPNNLAVTSLDDTELTAGTGFLCNFASGNTITVMYAGEVVQATTELDLTGLVYPMVANPVPVDLTLGEITADGMDPFTDIVQFLSSVNLAVTLTATYIDAATAAAFGDPNYQGWWDPNNLAVTSLDSTALPAGTAVLCNLASGNPVTVVFPNPML